MAAQDLGTKRACPDCSAKFYDFGVSDPCTCPKCSCAFTPEVKKPEPVPAPKPKPKPKPIPIVIADDEDDEALGKEMGGIEALEDFDDEYEDDVDHLEEVEDHHEDPDVDRNGDDAEDEMFLEDLDDHEKLVDSLSDYDEELELDEEE